MDQTVLSSKVYPYTTIQNHRQSIIVNQIDGSSSGDGSKEPVKRRRKRRSQGSSATTNEDDVRAMEGMFRKRKLTDEQVIMLEHSFENEHKLESGRKEKIAGGLGLDPRQVAVWFQNRRARWKNKKLEEEYAKLKSQHESLVLGQSHLESQVLKLTEQLSEAQNEIQKLSERLVVQETSTNSSSSSLSVEANDAPTGTTNYNIPLYMLDNSYLQNMEYWDGLFEQF